MIYLTEKEEQHLMSVMQTLYINTGDQIAKDIYEKARQRVRMRINRMLESIS